MSRGLLHSTIMAGLAAERPTIFPGDYDLAFYYATDEEALFVSPKPASVTTPNWRSPSGAPVLLGDADATIEIANAGRPHLIANVSADRTFTLPPVAEAAGCSFPFIATVGTADGHDWIFATAATDELFGGGVFALDSDPSPPLADVIVADQSDDDRFQVNLPEGGTAVTLTSNGTLWIASGTVLSATLPAFS